MVLRRPAAYLSPHVVLREAVFWQFDADLLVLYHVLCVQIEIVLFMCVLLYVLMVCYIRKLNFVSSIMQGQIQAWTENISGTGRTPVILSCKTCI